MGDDCWKISIWYFVPGREEYFKGFERNVKNHNQINIESKLTLKVIPLEETLQWDYTWGDRKESDHEC